MKGPRLPVLPIGFFLLIFAPAAHAAVLSATLLNTTIPFETVGLPTGATLQYVIDTPGNIDIEIHRLRDITDTPSVQNLVAEIQQNNQGGAPSGVAPLGTAYNFIWNGLWLIGGDQARQDGAFVFIVTLTSASAVSKFVVGQPLQITSVDIHNVSITPSFNANQSPAFPFRITYALAKDSFVTLKIKNATGAVVRTLLNNVPKGGEASISTNTLNWNGLDDTGRPVALGVYTMTVDAKDPLIADMAIPRTRTVPVHSLARLDADVKQVFDQNAFVYPNPVRDGNATFNLLAVRNNATISLKIYTITGDLVREESFKGLTTGNTVLFPWDGTNQSGKRVGRGLYYYVVQENDDEGRLQTTKKMAVIP